MSGVVTGRAGRTVAGREPAYAAVALGAALVLTALVLDTLPSAPLGRVLGTGFVVACVVVAVVVRAGEAFPVGVLPPLLMLAVLALAAVARPSALPGDGVAARLVTGLADHSLALVLGWAGALAVLLARRLTRSGTDPRPRAGAPRERPPTSPRPSSARPGSPPPR